MVGWELCAVDVSGPGTPEKSRGRVSAWPSGEQGSCPSQAPLTPRGESHQKLPWVPQWKGLSEPQREPDDLETKSEALGGFLGPSSVPPEPLPGDAEKRVVTIGPVLHGHHLVRTGCKANMIIPILQLRKLRLRDRK